MHGKQIAQGVFRRGALAGGIDGFAFQVGNGLDGFAALFHYVHNTQGVNGSKLHLALGFVVQHGSQIGRYGQHVHLALDHQGGQFVGSGGHGEVVVYFGFALFCIGQQLHHTDGSGALQAAKAQGNLFVFSKSGGDRYHHRSHQDKSNHFLHNIVPLSGCSSAGFIIMARK